MGVFLLIVLAGVTDWTIRLIVLNAKLSGRDSYTDVRLRLASYDADAQVMYHCYGHWGSAAVLFFQFAFAFGGCGLSTEV